MIVVFTGPSLPPSEVPAVPELRVLPPAAQGDVYRVARDRPWGIGIVDGFFEHVPAVWHKEILWAMSEGVHVFGAASMGALRAAELADFGMVGVGAIFAQFHTGALTDDDEVALAHLSAAHGYRRASEPMVDVRATLAAAGDAGACEPALAARLIALAKARFYAERDWPAVLGDARAAGEDPRALDALARWLPAGRVDQKRRDALAMIDAMRTARDAHPGRFQASFAFEHTDAWDGVLQHANEHAVPDAGTAPDAPATALLDHLHLLGEALAIQAVHGALLRGLAAHTADRHGVHVDHAQLREVAAAFRRDHALFTAATLAAWLAEQGLDPEAFGQLMIGEAKLRWAAAVFAPELRRHLADQLRAMGCLGRLQRAIAGTTRAPGSSGPGSSGIDDAHALEPEPQLAGALAPLDDAGRAA